MLEILRINESHSENISRLEEYLNNVEAYVLPIVKNKFGEAYANNMLRKMYKPEKKEIEKVQMRFHPNLPKEKKWIRVQITNETPLEMIKKTAHEKGLECRVEKDGYVLVYGENEKLKSFVKKIAETFHETRKH